MKLWGVLFFLGSISVVNAKNADTLEMPDEKPGIGVISHVEEETPQEDSDEMKADLSTFLKESTDVQKVSQEDSQEELEKPEPFLIVTTDQSSPPGGGVRLIDPNIEKLFPPLKDVPWWERWWNAMTSWFSDERSDE